MRNSLKGRSVAILFAFGTIVAGTGHVAAQALPTTAAQATGAVQRLPNPVLSLTPLRVDIVIQRVSREGAETARLPFTLFARADERPVSLRLGMSVPITVGAAVQYELMGTNIDFTGSMTPDGRFRASITLVDRSLVTRPSAGAYPLSPGPIREYSTSNYVVLRDGESAEFSVGTDPLSGEITKAQVTITSLK